MKFLNSTTVRSCLLMVGYLPKYVIEFMIFPQDEFLELEKRCPTDSNKTEKAYTISSYHSKQHLVPVPITFIPTVDKHFRCNTED